MRFQEIILPIQAHLEEFNIRFSDFVKSEVGLINTIQEHLQQGRGKQIRPVIVLLSAEVCGGATDASYRGAALIEMIHQASLLHDDVVDVAEQRRNQRSVNAQWDNQVAVLMGDFFLASALNIALKFDDISQLSIVNYAILQMSQGELLQMQFAANNQITEAQYLDIVGKKTAALLSACAECGAYSAKASNDQIERMRKIGHDIGIAFQIQDDLLDIDPDALTGKPLGNDLKEHKRTLPIIHFLQHQTEADRKLWEHRLQTFDGSAAFWADLHRALDQSGSMEYAKNVMKSYVHNAIEALKTFPDSPKRQAFIELIDFVANRKH